MKSAQVKTPNRRTSVYKEVRFSPTATLRRTRSMSGGSPPFKHRIVGTKAPTDDTFSILSTYVEQSQSLLESQRALFAQERQLWQKERALLRSRIAELQALLKNQSDEDTIPCSNPFSSKFLASYNLPQNSSENSNGESSQHHVWEGSSSLGKPTRVFEAPEKADSNNRLSPFQGLNSNPPPSLDAALSPRSRPVDQSANLPPAIPIERLDSKLDGISLKTTALPPEVASRAVNSSSPSPESSNAISAKPLSPLSSPSMRRKSSLKLKLEDLAKPDENLIRDAGHTPMVVVDGEADTNPASDNEGNVAHDKSSSEPSQATTDTPQPAENSNSYFPDLPEAPPNDPALKGPLSLLNDEEHDRGFLKELHEKLLNQTRERELGSTNSSQGPFNFHIEEQTDEELTSEEQVPALRFKKTTNFGTAFGIPVYQLKS